MNISLIEWPNEADWMEAKKRALVTAGLKPVTAPSENWKKDSLRARHSHIRRLRFSFHFEDIPSWVSVHFCRHVHAQPYIKSQRNDRQTDYDRNTAPQNAPVNMILDMNAEELMVMANKRLCNQASKETREAMQIMCSLVIEKCPEFRPFLVPMCEWRGGLCPEMKSCGKCVVG